MRLYISERQKSTLDMIKELNKREFGRVFTLEELPGVTMHTITALLEKGFLEHIPRTINSPKGVVVVDYYRWTEQELE